MTGTPEMRRHAEELLALARQQVAELDVEVDSPGAEVWVDGQRIGRMPLPMPVFVTVGPHTIVARAAKYPDARVVVNPAIGSVTPVVLDIMPQNENVIGYDAPASSGNRQVPSRFPTVPLIIGSTVSLGVIGTAVMLTTISRQQSHQAAQYQSALLLAGGSGSSCGSPTPDLASTCSALHESVNKRELYGNLATAGYVAGALSIATTTGLLIHLLSSSPSDTRTIVPSPMVSTKTGGLVLSGKF